MPANSHRTRSLVASLLAAVLLAVVVGLPAAGSDRPGSCPAKLGPLKFSSGETTGPGERFAKTRCFYRSDDWDKQATIRVAWIPAGQPDATLNMETTYCLSEDEEVVGDGQYGARTRTGRVFPTKGERFVLGTYLATAKGVPTAKVVKAARALAASYAADAAVCPTRSTAADEGAPVADEGAPAGDAASGPTTETFSDDEIYAGILDIADDLNAASAPAFDGRAVAACLGADAGGIAVAAIEEGPHARTVSRACAVLPVLLDDLPAEQATDITRLIVALLVADERRRQAEATATE